MNTTAQVQEKEAMTETHEEHAATKEERADTVFEEFHHACSMIAALLEIIDEHCAFEDLQLQDWRMLQGAREMALEVDGDPKMALDRWEKRFGMPAHREC